MASLSHLSDLIATHLSRKGTHIYLLRHGQSLGNHSGSIVGWTDSKLSVKGREQSNQLFRAFFPHLDKFTGLHSSDLSRCKDTLNLALGFPNRQVVYSQKLRELNFGDDEGVHFDSLPPEEKAKVNTLSYCAPNGENWVQVKQRAMEYLGGLQEGQHLVCTHGGLMCSLTYDLGVKYVVSNCSVISVELCPSKLELCGVNFVWEFAGSSTP